MKKNARFLTLLLSLFVIIGYTGCSDDSDPKLTLSITKIEFNADGTPKGNNKLNIKSNIFWAISVADSWCSYGTNENTGSGNKTGVEFTATINPFTVSRTTLITVSGEGIARKIQVTQDASDPLTLDFTQPANFVAGETKTIDYTATDNVVFAEPVTILDGWDVTLDTETKRITVKAPEMINENRGNGFITIKYTDSSGSRVGTAPLYLNLTVKLGDIYGDETDGAIGVIVRVNTEGQTNGTKGIVLHKDELFGLDNLDAPAVASWTPNSSNALEVMGELKALRTADVPPVMLNFVKWYNDLGANWYIPTPEDAASIMSNITVLNTGLASIAGIELSESKAYALFLKSSGSDTYGWNLEGTQPGNLWTMPLYRMVGNDWSVISGGTIANPTTLSFRAIKTY